MSTTALTINSTVPVPADALSAAGTGGATAGAGAPAEAGSPDFSGITGHVKHAADQVASWYLHSALGHALTMGPAVEKGAADVQKLGDVARGEPDPEEREAASGRATFAPGMTPGPDPVAPWNQPFGKFRQGLENMSGDMHKFADSHATQLNPGARSLLHAVATALENTPVGSSALETAAMLPMGGEGKKPRLGPGKDFYSTLEHTIETKLPEKMTGEQLVNTLKNAGVPKAELSNVEHLAGKAQVTRAEALAHVEARTPHVETIEKGGKAPVDPHVQKLQDEHARIREDLKGSLRDELGLSDQRANQIIESYQQYAGGEMGPEHDTLVDKIMKWSGKPVLEQEARDWVKEYGQNLEKLNNLSEELGAHEEGFLPNEGPKYESYTLPGGSNYREVLLTLPATDEAAHDPDPYVQRGLRVEGSSSDYYGPHFDEPNVVAHLRLKDREIGGKKTLFIEELQSDWARELRENREPVEGDTPADTGARAARDEARIPSMPFDKAWHELALKKALDIAAKEGYDQVAWTTGAQQADRYNLRHYFDAVKLTETDDGFELAGLPRGGGSTLRQATTAEALPGLVGKENAKELLKQIEENPAEKDPDFVARLKFDGPVALGGEHHLRLYDEMVPQFLGRYTKRWGGKVGEAQLDVPKKLSSRTPSPYPPPDVYSNLENEPVKVHALPITNQMREGIKRGQPLFGGGNIDFSTIQGHVGHGEAEAAVAPESPEARKTVGSKGSKPLSEQVDTAGGESELERLRRNPPAPVKEMTPEEQAKADVAPGSSGTRKTVNDATIRTEPKAKMTSQATVAAGGTGAASSEELARKEVFVKYNKAGQPTYLGKSPDATLKEGEAVLAVDPTTGKVRAQNVKGMSDVEAVGRFGRHAEKAFGPKKRAQDKLSGKRPIEE